MSTARAEKTPQPSGNDIRWVISERQINALNLPAPTIVDNRRLNATVEDNEVAIGIFALPPKEQSTSVFWAKILKKSSSIF